MRKRVEDRWSMSRSRAASGRRPYSESACRPSTRRARISFLVTRCWFSIAEEAIDFRSGTRIVGDLAGREIELSARIHGRSRGGPHSSSSAIGSHRRPEPPWRSSRHRSAKPRSGMRRPDDGQVGRCMTEALATSVWLCCAANGRQTARSRRSSMLAMAADSELRAGIAPRRRLPLADRAELPGATARVGAAPRAARQRRRAARARLRHAGFGPGVGHQQLVRIGVERRREDGAGGADLEQLAAKQDADTIGERPHHGEIVSDEQHRDAVLGAQALQKVEDAGLHRDVERREDLVAQQQRRARSERPGDRDPLALAARELVGVARGIGGIQPHVLEQRRDALPNCAAAAGGRRVERPGDGVADGAARVERGVGILEDVLDLLPHRVRARRARARQRLAREADAGPCAGAIRPLIARAMVDLPLPDSPTSAKVSPRSTAKDTPCTTSGGSRPSRRRPGARPAVARG